MEYHKSKPNSETQALFGIVQGGREEKLRKESAEVIANMKSSNGEGFDGFGIGATPKGSKKKKTEIDLTITIGSGDGTVRRGGRIDSNHQNARPDDEAWNLTRTLSAANRFSW